MASNYTSKITTKDSSEVFIFLFSSLHSRKKTTEISGSTVKIHKHICRQLEYFLLTFKKLCWWLHCKLIYNWQVGLNKSTSATSFQFSLLNYFWNPKLPILVQCFHGRVIANAGSKFYHYLPSILNAILNSKFLCMHHLNI